MDNYEKRAFLKFFMIYFISVSMLILISGFLYFIKIENHILNSEEFSLVDYGRCIKMGDSLDRFKNDFSIKIVQTYKDKYINIRNFTITDKYFKKVIPIKQDNGYIEISKSKKSFNKKISNLRKRVIIIQIILIIIFAYISYYLAQNALKPLQKSISILDSFAKDLIHDLNTPVTSIKLNLKLLEKIDNISTHKAFIRLNKGVNSISLLHENLTILLEEKTFLIKDVDISNVVSDIIEVQKTIYPNIKFISDCIGFRAKVNSNAIKQLLENIISNASKYNNENGYVKVYSKHKLLYIEDSGKGILNPDKIFDRNYSERDSSGIGLDIVKRLALAMNIDIKVENNSSKGVTFILKFG